MMTARKSSNVHSGGGRGIPAFASISGLQNITRGEKMNGIP